MEIGKALKVFEILDITKEDESTLKKAYRQLSRKYHPDVYKDNGSKFREVSESYKVLLDLLKQVRLLEILDKQLEEKIIQITLSDLIQVYKEGSALAVSGETITKADLYKHRVLILFSTTLWYDNTEQTFSSISLWNIGDRYEIQLESFEDNIFEEKDFKVEMLDNVKTIHIRSQTIQYIITLDFNIKVSIVITRKVKSNS